MSALWTALVEGETKESLATMVCEAREHAEEMAAEASRLAVENARLIEDRATRLIRALCERSPESPGCLWPKCDCGTAPPLDE